MTSTKINLIGQKFGKLTVIGPAVKTPEMSSRAYWTCRCDCDGNIDTYNSRYLRNGSTRSCGCLRREIAIANSSFPSKLTSEQHEMIVGHLLGDAYLVKDTLNCSLSFTRAKKDKPYLQVTIDMLKDLFKEDAEIRDKIRIGAIHEYSNVESAKRYIINNYRHWYDENKFKRVPKDIELTPLTLAVWVCDDGHIRCNKTYIGTKLSTEGFIEEDVDLLVGKLNDLYGKDSFEKRMNGGLTKEDEHQKFIIIGNTIATIKLIRTIESYLPKLKMTRKIKWNEEILKRYENPQYKIRRTNNLQDAIIKDRVVLEFFNKMADEDEKFNKQDLARYVQENCSWYKNDMGEYTNLAKKSLRKRYLDKEVENGNIEKYELKQNKILYKISEEGRIYFKNELENKVATS